jgi:hypothetical protein
MPKTLICRDPEEARRLWQQNWPQHCLFDLWPVRACFDTAYGRPPYFIVIHENGECRGVMALSWIAEENYYGHFPGECWHAKTWLEQNKIPAASPEDFQLLWDLAPTETHIRYLNNPGRLANGYQFWVDEVGYLFYPRQVEYSFDRYWQGFSGRSRKKIRHELSRLEASGITYRYDRLSDVDVMLRLNLESFGGESYFSDPRFLRAFSNLAAWLHDNRMLRVTTVLIGGEVAAVDMGAVWHNTYSVLAGGTRSEFPGVAKLINLHHLEWSCRERFSHVDFLCGDFNWKNRFHLTPRPLYQMQKIRSEAQRLPAAAGLEAAYAF